MFVGAGGECNPDPTPDKTVTSLRNPRKLSKIPPILLNRAKSQIELADRPAKGTLAARRTSG